MSRFLGSNPGRLTNWVSIAGRIIEAEFPSYGVLMKLAQATHLDPGKTPSKANEGRLPSANNAALHSLCRAWKWDWEPWNFIELTIVIYCSVFKFQVFQRSFLE